MIDIYELVISTLQPPQMPPMPPPLPPEVDLWQVCAGVKMEGPLHIARDPSHLRRDTVEKRHLQWLAG